MRAEGADEHDVADGGGQNPSEAGGDAVHHDGRHARQHQVEEEEDGEVAAGAMPSDSKSARSGEGREVQQEPKVLHEPEEVEPCEPKAVEHDVEDGEGRNAGEEGGDAVHHVG